jgi:hypothetical protein
MCLGHAYHSDECFLCRRGAWMNENCTNLCVRLVHICLCAEHAPLRLGACLLMRMHHAHVNVLPPVFVRVRVLPFAYAGVCLCVCMHVRL